MKRIFFQGEIDCNLSTWAETFLMCAGRLQLETPFKLSGGLSMCLQKNKAIQNRL